MIQPLRKCYCLNRGSIISMFIIAAVASQCSAQNQSVKLLGGLHSRQTIAAVRQQLGDKAEKWEVKEDSKLSHSDERPRFEMFSVNLKDFSDLGVTGDLFLIFFNDRLMTTTFFPIDFDTYKSRLEAERKITILELLPAPLRSQIYAGRASSGRRCVVVKDIHLEAEMREWLDKYA